MILAETFSELLRDPAHWAMEGISEVVSYLVVGLLLAGPVKRWMRRWHKRHDADFHPEATEPVKEMDLDPFRLAAYEAWKKDSRAGVR